MQVTLYSKPDCQLCEEVKADLLSFQIQMSFALFERNIEEDPELFARFRYLIPVVYPPHSWHSIYQALQAAQRAEQERTAPSTKAKASGRGER
jgi:hypothetical protein